MSGIDLTLMTSSGSQAALRAVDPSDELLPGSTAGEYEIVQKIGEGGMGSVYGARHPVIGKRAAIKVIHRGLSASAEAVDRFIREAQAVNQIGHPNIVDVFGFGQLPDGRRFFVMEWLKGEPLSQRIRRPLSFDEALEILDDVAKALEAAHDARVLHRDLKPDNVFLQDRKGERPVVKLLDFGLAKLSGSNEGGLEHTRTGVVMGTPLYLSPEQAKGTKVEFPTDIYSLGAMAYEMLCGQVPFRAESAVETMAMHISQPPIPLRRIRPELPEEIEELVRTMLEKSPKARPLIAQVRAALAALRDPAAVRSRDSRPSTSTVNPLARSEMALAMTTATGEVPKTRVMSMPMIFGAVAALAAGITIVVFLVGRRPASNAPDKPDTIAADTTKPAKTAPDKSAPDKSAPAKIAPDTSAPAKTAPDKSAPAKTAPDKSAPDPAPAGMPAAAGDKSRTVKPGARPGTVVITVSGAPRSQILIDDKIVAKGTVSLTQALPPGEHIVKARAKGFKPAIAKVRVIAGRTHDVRLDLKQATSVNAVHDPFDD